MLHTKIFISNATTVSSFTDPNYDEMWYPPCYQNINQSNKAVHSSLLLSCLQQERQQRDRIPAVHVIMSRVFGNLQPPETLAQQTTLRVRIGGSMFENAGNYFAKPTCDLFSGGMSKQMSHG